MKNKNKFFLFLVAVLFSSVFFVVSKAEANQASEACIFECVASGEDRSYCEDGCSYLDAGGFEQVYDCGGTDCTSEEWDLYNAGVYDCGGMDCTLEEWNQYNAADTCPLGNTGDPDCSCADANKDGYCDYVDTGVYGDGSSECQTDNDCEAFYPGKNYTCSGFLTKTCEPTQQSCNGNYDTATCCEMNGGFWATSLNTCYTDKNNYCVDTMGASYVWSTTFQECRGTATSDCTANSDCGIGYDCVNSSCALNYLGVVGINSGGAGAVKTAVAKTLNGVNIPANSIINADGSITSPSGNQLLPAGSYNSSNASTIPVVATGNPGGNSGGGGAIITGGMTTAGCGAGFESIGGVCFPVKSMTGLSDAPIYLIISNLFSWLMGLFTTLAVLAFVVSGIQNFMSAGDEGMAETSKENAKNALVGIIMGLSGFIIVKAIAAALSGTSVLF